MTSTTVGELAEAGRWFAAAFEGRQQPHPYAGCLEPSFVYTAVNARGRPELQKNGATTRVYYLESKVQALKIGDNRYASGLYFPTTGAVVARLPGPGARFEATVGVDSNQRTSFYSNTGRGRVIARVEAGGRESFRSGIMRESDPGVAVSVDLGGAAEFTLETIDAGGIVFRTDFNQVAWADARVTLADGRVLRLGDLPIGPLRSPHAAELPFSFQYGGRPSGELLKTWRHTATTRTRDDGCAERTLTWLDPESGLEVICVGLLDPAFPVVEWTLSFKNTSDRATPLLEGIVSLDTTLERDNEGEFVLRHNDGSAHSMVQIGSADYRPLETRLERGLHKAVGSANGLPAAKDFPFFNVDRGGAGVIVAIGWPGQWAGHFTRDGERGLRFVAGQELIRTTLLPGEEVRAPRIVLLFWEGDWIRGQNLWRRWMMARNMPRPGGKLPPPLIAAASSSFYIEMAEANEQNQLAFINRFVEENIPLDYWWIDAGWHVFRDFWLNIGTWEPDPDRFPRGLRPIADHLHALGKKMILWFAAESATPGTKVYTRPAEWLLGRDDERFKQLNLGVPEARAWLTDYVDAQIKAQGVDLYRHDGNPPGHYWRGVDAEDRQGMVENHYVQGYVEYWDALRSRNPDILTDICAGGGGRNDVEGLRRAVPLWRSDYAFETTGMQNLTYGLALWVPYFGCGVIDYDAYACRSQMAPALVLSWDVRRRDLDYTFMRRFLAQWREVADNYYGDFYPLTAYRIENDVWMAWQFDRPEAGKGMIQAFRRPRSDVESMRFRLCGLDSASRYRVLSLESDEATPPALDVVLDGRDLLEDGLMVTLPSQPAAALITYERLEGAPM